jgi:hypothetical protein
MTRRLAPQTTLKRQGPDFDRPRGEEPRSMPDGVFMLSRVQEKRNGKTAQDPSFDI